MAISRRLRFEILRRDGYTCRYCGAKAPDVPLAVDHVIPETLGGGDDPSNLVTACQPCNAGKGSIAPDAALVADVDATAMLFAQGMERAVAQRLAELEDLEALLGRFYDLWCSYMGTDSHLQSGWESTIENYLAGGLVESDLARYVNVAMSARIPAGRLWRYFCGCCRNEVTTRQELARQMIEDGKV